MQAFAGRPPGIASNEVSTYPEYFNFEENESGVAVRVPQHSTFGRFLTTREDLSPRTPGVADRWLPKVRDGDDSFQTGGQLL